MKEWKGIQTREEIGGDWDHYSLTIHKLDHSGARCSVAAAAAAAAATLRWRNHWPCNSRDRGKMAQRAHFTFREHKREVSFVYLAGKLAWLPRPIDACSLQSHFLTSSLPLLLSITIRLVGGCCGTSLHFSAHSLSRQDLFSPLLTVSLLVKSIYFCCLLVLLLLLLFATTSIISVISIFEVRDTTIIVCF